MASLIELNIGEMLRVAFYSAIQFAFWFVVYFWPVWLILAVIYIVTEIISSQRR